MTYGQRTTAPLHPLLQFLVNESELDEAAAQTITPTTFESDSLWTCLHQLYAQKYGLSVGQNRFGFFTREDGEQAALALVNQLYLYTLISEKTYQNLSLQIQQTYNDKEPMAFGSQPLFDAFDIFLYLYEWEQFKRHRVTLSAYLEQLEAHGLLAAHWRLAFLPETPLELVERLEKSLVIKYKELPEDLEAAYKVAFEQVQLFLPNLECTNFRYSIEDYLSWNDEWDKQVVVRFESKGRTYRIKLSYAQDKSATNMQFSDRFFLVFNRVLVDQGSKYRLLLLDQEGFKETFGSLLLVDQSQSTFLTKASKLRRNGYYFNRTWYLIGHSTYYLPFDWLSQDQIAAYFQYYERLDLFSHLTDDAKKQALEDCQQSPLTDQTSILYELDHIVLFFDWEMSYGKTPYKKAFEEFASISRGAFQPKAIQDDFDFSKQKSTIGFVLNNTNYQTEVAVAGDWYEPDFIQLIHKALNEQGIDGRFYHLGEDGGQASNVIYLNKEQYQLLSSDHKLFLLE